MIISELYRRGKKRSWWKRRRRLGSSLGGCGGWWPATLYRLRNWLLVVLLLGRENVSVDYLGNLFPFAEQTSSPGAAAAALNGNSKYNTQEEIEEERDKCEVDRLP